MLCDRIRCGASPAALARENLASGTPDRAGGRKNTALSRSPFDVMFADVRTAPVLREASVDVCVSDLPFGKRCLGRDALPRLYAKLITFLARVLRPGTGRAVLMTGELHLLLGPAGTTPFWEPVTESDKTFVRHGPGGWAAIVVMRRSVVAFCHSRRARIRENRCLQCGGLGHYKRDCPAAWDG